jgi:alkylhydroperoxidase family enzyme
VTDIEARRASDVGAAANFGRRPRGSAAGTEELHRTSTVSDETWAELPERFDPAQLVELGMTVGRYTMLSMVANALGVATEPGLSPLPS